MYTETAAHSQQESTVFDEFFSRSARAAIVVAPVRVRPAPTVRLYLSLFAPGLLAEAGAYEDRIYAEHVSRGDTFWRKLGGVGGRAAVSMHLEAGRTQAPVGGRKRRKVRAVGLVARPSDVTRIANLDLDSEEAARAVIAALRDLVGDRALLATSGSGRPGRYRLFLLLSEPARVERMHDLLTSLLTSLGLPPRKGFVEIFPSTSNGRLPFGCGGCRTFDLELRPACADRSPLDLAADVASLDFVDLERLAGHLPPPPRPLVREPAEGRGNPYRRRERARPTPRRIRALWAGKVRPGERSWVLFALAQDCLYSGLSYDEAVAKIEEWIRAKGLEHSRDVRRRGEEWQIRLVPKIVRDAFTKLPGLGRPEGVPLSEAEIIRARELARSVAPSCGFPVERLERLLLAVLPVFKACRLARLPMVRFHCREWQRHGGPAYARMRDALGIFRSATGYKASALVDAGKGGRPSEAYARSWITSFAFDDEALPSRSPKREGVLPSDRPTTSAVSPPVDLSDKRLYVHRYRNAEEIVAIETPERTRRRPASPRARRRRRAWRPAPGSFDSLTSFFEAWKRHDLETAARMGPRFKNRPRYEELDGPEPPASWEDGEHSPP